MIIVLPVFPRNGFEEKILWQEVAEELFLVRQLKGLKGKDTYVFTDQAEVRHTAKQLGLRCKCIALNRDPAGSEILPPGTAKSLQTLWGAYGVAKGCPVGILDYRITPLPLEVIQDAYRQFTCSPAKVLLSVAQIKGDHPCLLDAYYLTQQIDVLFFHKKTLFFKSLFQNIDRSFLLHYGERLNLFHLSRSQIPFFDIDLHSLFTLPLQHHSEQTLPYCCVPLQKTTSANLSQQTYYFSPNHLPVHLSIHYKYILLRESYRFFLYVREDLVRQNSLLRVWLVGAKLYPGHQREPLHRRVIGNVSFLGPLCSLPSRITLRGIIVAIFDQTEGQVGDIARPLEVEENLWKYDARSKSRINTLTGQKITGRQDLMDVYEPHRAFIIFQGELFDQVEGIVFSGQAEGFLVPTEQFTSVLSTLDLIQAEIRMKSKSTNPKQAV